MKILFVSSGRPRVPWRKGAQVATRRTIDALHSVYGNDLMHLDDSVIPWPESMPAHAPNADFNYISVQKAAEALGGGKIDLILTSTHGAIPRALALRTTFAHRAVPLVSLVHSLSHGSFVSELTALIASKELLPCDRFVCPSGASAKALQNLWNEAQGRFKTRWGVDPGTPLRIKKIPAPVPTKIFHPGNPAEARQKLQLPVAPDAVLVLALSRLSRRDKASPLVLFEALSRVKEMAGGVKLQFMMAGDDAYKESVQLIELSKRAGLGDTFFVVPDFPDNVHADLFRAADIYALPADSLQESCSLTVAEALASGLPVVCSDWDGLRELVTPGISGFTVPTTLVRGKKPHFDGADTQWGDHLQVSARTVVDVEALTAALLKLVTDAQLRKTQGKAARKFAEERLATEVVAAQWKTFLQELCYEARETAMGDRLTPSLFCGALETAFRDWPTKIIKENQIPELYPPMETALQAQSVFSLPKDCEEQIRLWKAGRLAPGLPAVPARAKPPFGV